MSYDLFVLASISDVQTAISGFLWYWIIYFIYSCFCVFEWSWRRRQVKRNDQLTDGETPGLLVCLLLTEDMKPQKTKVWCSFIETVSAPGSAFGSDLQSVHVDVGEKKLADFLFSSLTSGCFSSSSFLLHHLPRLFELCSDYKDVQWNTDFILL